MHALFIYAMIYLFIFFPYKELILEALFPSTVFRIPHKFSRVHSTRPYQRTEKISLICFIFNLTILCNLIINPNSTMTVRLRIELSFLAARITGLGRESVWKRYIWQAAWKPHWQITCADGENKLSNLHFRDAHHFFPSFDLNCSQVNTDVKMGA